VNSDGRTVHSGRLDDLDSLPRLVFVDRKEGDAHGVLADGRELESGDRAQEGVWDLGGDAGAIAGGRLSARGTSVVEVVQSGQGLAHDRVAGAPMQIRKEGNTACVRLELRVVQTLSRRQGGKRDAHAGFSVSVQATATTMLFNVRGRQHCRHLRPGTTSARSSVLRLPPGFVMPTTD